MIIEETTIKLDVEGLTKSFTKNGEELLALSDVSCEVKDGEFISIVGASGCGKTTFLRMISGLVAPSGGSINLSGVPLGGPGPDRGFVFQHDSLLPWRNVLDNVLIGPEINGRRVQAREAAQANIRLVGLEGFEKHFPHELSGGMRQRVNLARALTLDPEILLMDEPFAALDSQTREVMQSELLNVWELAKKTVLFVTHQIDEAVFLSDRVFVFTVRPGRMKEIVEIDLPRPRDLSIKRTPEFAALVDRIWSLIEHEVRQSIDDEIAQSLQEEK
ncbi:ABC transporter ATP-binding protein [Cryobacterium glaciale]|uniref:ABC transporter ATP-binding protein n=1 Tax=Cryobacterium glaciale TaxID=1259145 RepID=UPI001F53ED8D|nr:ABC transporter ATP-binding protein [Cryobacterium glaciale]